MLDLSKYACRYVALDTREFKVVAEGSDPDEVWEKVIKQGLDVKYISIDYVNCPDDIVFL